MGKIRDFLSLKNKHGDWKILRLSVGFVMLMILVTVFFAGMFYMVGVGEAVLIVDPVSSSISDVSLGPSYGIKMPWQTAIITYVATDSLGMWGNGTDKYANFPSIACFSRDQLEMEIDVMVRWQLDPSKVRDLYQRYPLRNWKDTTIASVVREEIRLKTKDYKAIDTIENRDLVRGMIAQAIENKLTTEPSLCGAIINFEFELRNIGYPASYTQAIEEKLATEQSKIQAEFEAEKIIILATASAEKVLIEAQAFADAKVIESEGMWQAIDTLTSNSNMSEAELTELYITLQTLKDIANTSGNSYFFIGFDEGVPFIIPIEPNS